MAGKLFKTKEYIWQGLHKSNPPWRCCTGDYLQHEGWGAFRLQCIPQKVVCRMAQSFLPPALQSHPEWEWAWGFASRKAMVMTEHPLEGDLTQFPRTSNICIFFHPLGLWREVMTWAALRRGSCDRMLQVWLLTKSFVNEFTRRSFPTQPWQRRLSHIWLQPYERTRCRGYRFLTQKW